MDLSEAEIAQVVRQALAEDLGSGDATTEATVPAETRALAWMRSRQPLVAAGLNLARETFLQVDPAANLQVDMEVREGAWIGSGEVLLRVAGPAKPILSAERVALNFVQRLSGIATLTARFVEAVRGTQAVILDTRKTTPGWRALEKYAVRCGGGQNHRAGLFDMILIKDNHLAALRGAKPNPIAVAVGRSRRAYPELRVEVEADTLEQVEQAVAAGADVVLLDNMTPEQLSDAVRVVRRRCRTEASGGVDLLTVGRIAATGVDYISVGALTHSAPAADVGLDFQ